MALKSWHKCPEDGNHLDNLSVDVLFLRGVAAHLSIYAVVQKQTLTQHQLHPPLLLYQQRIRVQDCSKGQSAWESYGPLSDNVTAWTFGYNGEFGDQVRSINMYLLLCTPIFEDINNSSSRCWNR